MYTMENNRDNLQRIRDLTYKLTLRDEDVFKDHKLFKLLQESTGDGYWDLDFVNGIKYMSHAYKRQLGYDPDEIENSHDGDFHLCDSGDLEKIKDNLEDHILSKGSVPFGNILKYRHKEGHDVFILCRGAVVEWDGDKPIRMVGTHVDVTASMEKIKECCNG